MPSDIKVEFTPRAIENLNKCSYRLDQVKYEHPDKYPEMAQSFIRSVVAMCGIGGRVTAEDDLGLYGYGGALEFGFVFHADLMPKPGPRYEATTAITKRSKVCNSHEEALEWAGTEGTVRQMDDENEIWTRERHPLLGSWSVNT